MSADDVSEAPSKPTGRKSAAASAPNLGKALRTVYDDTLREEVPNDLMDLLGKLR